VSSKMIPWLYGLQHFGVKLGLDNIRALLDLLGHPEAAYPSILVGGTNGKGSVAAMAESIMGAAGLRTGMFTSPHLVRPNERIRIAGLDIESDELDSRLAAMRETIEQGLAGGDLEAHPSFFEVITATALQSFADHGVQAAILEVGLGGRLDATNAVDADVSVIVSVGLDHTKTLGPTLERIAGEKAGIIKPGKPVVSGVVQQRAIDEIHRICEQRGALWVDARERVQLVEERHGRFTLVGRRQSYPELELALAGRHQIDNARVALAAVELLAERLGVEIGAEAVRAGLAGVRWNGRLQWIEPEDGRPAMLLDAAHNPAGMDALISYLRRQQRPAPVLLFGATRGKPLHRLLEPLAPLVHGLVITQPPVTRGLDPDEVAAVAQPMFAIIERIPEPARAFRRACQMAGSERYVLVTGSLYLVGEVLGLASGEPVPGPVSM